MQEMSDAVEQMIKKVSLDEVKEDDGGDSEPEPEVRLRRIAAEWARISVLEFRESTLIAALSISKAIGVFLDEYENDPR